MCKSYSSSLNVFILAFSKKNKVEVKCIVDEAKSVIAEVQSIDVEPLSLMDEVKYVKDEADPARR